MTWNRSLLWSRLWLGFGGIGRGDPESVKKTDETHAREMEYYAVMGAI